MRQYESCIQIIIIRIKKRIKTKKKKKVKRGEWVRACREREKKIFFFLFLSLLLPKIYGNWIISFRRSKRKSSSTHRELLVGTKNLAFRQTPRGREFFYLCYFYPKGHLMSWDFPRGRERP